MHTYNIHDANTQLPRLVELAAKGESFVIAKSGRPIVKVAALDVPEQPQVKWFVFWQGKSACLKTSIGWAKR